MDQVQQLQNNLSLDSMQQLIQDFLPMGIEYGLNLLAAIFILVIGFWIAGRFQKSVRNLVLRLPQIDDMLAGFFSSIIRYAVLTITFLAVLSQFGVQTTSLIAVLGAASLAIGLALQGTLSNLAAGVMLLIFRPFKVGEYVEVGGQAGTVKELTLFHTEMATPDNVHIVMPNGSIWGQPIKNYSYHGTRRVDLLFGISYGDDINQAMDVIKQAVADESRCLHEPEPFVGVTSLGDFSVDIVLRVWTLNADYWPVTFALRKDIKERFDKQGITIPFPTRTVFSQANEGGPDAQKSIAAGAGAGAPSDSID